MCGILGFVGTRWREDAAKALAALSARGPDEQRLSTFGEAVLGHARLAVIDVAGGRQPMSTNDGNLAIVFNGEIYNAGALRRELEGQGIHFETDHSDTEVLLHGYRAWGDKMLGRLDGMFAFAIWDRHARQMFAARDKFGIKPFMYAATEGGLVIASTLAPFLALPGFPRQLDKEALRDYLAYQTPLSPHTFLRSVRQLPPAHWMRFDARENRIELGRWWDIPRPGHVPEDREELLESIDQALRESVRRQLVSDVPLGAFLSGGIDSSLMVRYMAEAGGRPVETFSLGFAEAEYDESAAALEVSAAFGTRHHRLEAPDIGGEAFAAAISKLDQPLADPAYVMTESLSRLTREHVTVAISGDGGDELFGGYARYSMPEESYPGGPWKKILRYMIDGGLLPGSLTRRALSGQEMLLYRNVEVGKWRGRKQLARYLNPGIVNDARPDRTLQGWTELVEALGGHMDSSTLMRADLWTYLSENCLTKTDRASMAHGLEVRVPMLGEPVIQAVLGLPASVHLAGGSKAMLTELARRHLPERVWNRSKHGFSVPLQQLFSGAWREVCDDVIANAGKTAPFLNDAAVGALWRAARRGSASRRLAYSFIVLLLWMQQRGISLDT
jgi:asparagine synthase (glutamine-hydrolysing)